MDFSHLLDVLVKKTGFSVTQIIIALLVAATMAAGGGGATYIRRQNKNQRFAIEKRNWRRVEHYRRPRRFR